MPARHSRFFRELPISGWALPIFSVGAIVLFFSGYYLYSVLLAVFFVVCVYDLLEWVKLDGK